MSYDLLKGIVCNLLIRLKVDALLRSLNKKKLVVVMYHGVSKRNYDPPVWTQLPADVFRRQVQYLKSHYKIVSLSEAIGSLSDSRNLPERSVLITFDDGLKNNHSVAFPILKEYGVPGTVFLTVEMVGTEELLWVDELYLLLRKGVQRELVDPEGCSISSGILTKERVWDVYFNAVERLKRASDDVKKMYMEALRRQVGIDRREFLDDFGMLDWDQVREMKESGLVEFGVHTAYHRILTSLKEEDWAKEIKRPLDRLSMILGGEARAFCYPNGRPGVDFTEAHVRYLRECGYSCAFTTDPSLFDPIRGDAMRIGRIPAGNDFTSQDSYFRLAVSGLWEKVPVL